MQRILLLADHISTWVGKTFSWSIVVLTVVTVYDVTARYLFESPTTWAYDTEYILYGTLFIMAGAYTLSRNAHVRGDVIYRLWPVRVQGGIDVVLYLLFFFPGMLALLYAGFDFASQSWMMNEHSSSSPEGPPIYPFKMLIPAAAFFLLLQGLAELIRAYTAMRTGKWPARLHDVAELEVEILEQAKEGISGEKIMDHLAHGTPTEPTK